MGKEEGRIAGLWPGKRAPWHLPCASHWPTCVHRLMSSCPASAEVSKMGRLQLRTSRRPTQRPALARERNDLQRADRVWRQYVPLYMIHMTCWQWGCRSLVSFRWGCWLSTKCVQYSHNLAHDANIVIVPFQPRTKLWILPMKDLFLCSIVMYTERIDLNRCTECDTRFKEWVN